MSLKDFLRENLPRINGFLSSWVRNSGLLGESIRYALFPGGKRFRPLLVLASCECAGGKIEDAIPVAGAIELIHSFTLVHDDLPCMDNDDFRRGKPSLHRTFGEGIAVLAGDALLNLAYEVVVLSPLPSNIKIKILKEFTSTLGFKGILKGQVEDIRIGKREKNLEKLKYIYALKTGSLIKTAVRCGCILAKGKKELLERLTLYGENLGLGFQIMDDVEEAREGRTPDFPDFPTILGIEEAEKIARDYILKAKKIISPLGEKGQILKEMAEWVIKKG